jgi:co-chaperonin GroES (HSP10)
MIIQNVKPCGEMVLLEFHKVEDEIFKKNKGGILVYNEKKDEKDKYYAIVKEIGPKVDRSTIDFKEGDKVFYNEYDCKVFGDDENTYGLLKASSIWAVYSEADK